MVFYVNAHLFKFYYQEILRKVCYVERKLKVNESRYITLFVVSGSRGGSRTAATSKRSILDVAAVLDPPLGSIKKVFSIDCVNIYFSQSIVLLILSFLNIF